LKRCERSHLVRGSPDSLSLKSAPSDHPEKRNLLLHITRERAGGADLRSVLVSMSGC
jgi:hypothetical protein